MGGMALIDYIDTKNRIIKYLGHGAKTPDEVRNMMIRPTEDEADLDSLLEEMKEANLIHNHFGRLHLITPQSEERRKNKKAPRPKEADPWAWYAWLPESLDFRKKLREEFTKADGEVFRALAAVITNERTPRIGERLAGPITEDEGKYIVAVNERLMAYLKKKDEQSG